jgi:flagellar motility protein MotE (MotC chaperone)
MADDKDKDIEVVGLEDESEAQAPKTSFLKKYLIKILIAVIVVITLIAASIIYNLLSNSKSDKTATGESSDKAVAETKASVKEPSEIEKTVSELNDSLSIYEIDTAAIMKELAFLDYNPDKIVDSQKTVVVKDSVDTLNWIQKEMAQLAEEKTRLDSRQKDLEDRESKVNLGMTKLNQAEATRIISLAKLYDGMRPDEAANLFENLDDTIVVAILPRMKPANASKILGLMPPKRAAEISTRLISIAEK